MQTIPSAVTLWRFLETKFFGVMEMDDRGTADYWSGNCLKEGEEQMGFDLLQPLTEEQLHSAIKEFYNPLGYEVTVGSKNGYVVLEKDNSIQFNVVISLGHSHLEIGVDTIYISTGPKPQN
jgi:hypothetical protein